MAGDLPPETDAPPYNTEMPSDDSGDEVAAPPQEEADIVAWRVASREQILRGMQEMLPCSVHNCMFNLLEPIKADIRKIRKRQVASDKLVSRLSHEVNAVRVTGQYTQDQVAALSAKIVASTRSADAMAMAQSTPNAQAASSSQAPRAAQIPQQRAAEHHKIGTPRASSPTCGRSDGQEPEAIRRKLVSWRYKVHGEHIRSSGSA